MADRLIYEFRVHDFGIIDVGRGPSASVLATRVSDRRYDDVAVAYGDSRADAFEQAADVLRSREWDVRGVTSGRHDFHSSRAGDVIALRRRIFEKNRETLLQPSAEALLGDPEALREIAQMDSVKRRVEALGGDPDSVALWIAGRSLSHAASDLWVALMEDAGFRVMVEDAVVEMAAVQPSSIGDFKWAVVLSVQGIESGTGLGVPEVGDGGAVVLLWSGGEAAVRFLDHWMLEMTTEGNNDYGPALDRDKFSPDPPLDAMEMGLRTYDTPIAIGADRTMCVVHARLLKYMDVEVEQNDLGGADVLRGGQLSLARVDSSVFRGTPTEPARGRFDTEVDDDDDDPFEEEQLSP